MLRGTYLTKTNPRRNYHTTIVQHCLPRLTDAKNNNVALGTKQIGEGEGELKQNSSF